METKSFNMVRVGCVAHLRTVGRGLVGQVLYGLSNFNEVIYLVNYLGIKLEVKRCLV